MPLGRLLPVLSVGLVCFALRQHSDREMRACKEFIGYSG